MEGYIAAHRKMLDNPTVCKDADHFAVWMYLLLNAVYKPTDVMFHGERITLQAGQLTTGRKKIAEHFGISESKVQRILKRFEIEHQIEQRTDRQCRLITIVSWGEYQISEQRNEQQVNNDRTTTEQRVNTKEEINKVIKKRNSNIYDQSIAEEFEKLWEMYPKKQGKKRALADYAKARKNGTTYEEVEEGIAAYVEYIRVRGTEDKFIKQGSTFFSQQAWQDDWSTKGGMSGRTNSGKSNEVRSRMADAAGRSTGRTSEFQPFVSAMEAFVEKESRSQGDA